MEFDLDSFLRSRGGVSLDSSDEDESTATHRRTVDEILNDTDSSSSCSPHTLPNLSCDLSIEDGTMLKEEQIDERDDDHSSPVVEAPDELYKWKTRTGELSFSSYLPSAEYASYSKSLSSLSTSLLPFSSLFSGVSSKPKPGAAVAAAAAASRSVPTPHAAAIKSKRAIGENNIKISLHKDTQESMDVGASFVREVLDEPDFSLVALSRRGGNEDDELLESSLPAESSSLSALGKKHELLLGVEVSSEEEQSFMAIDGDTSEKLNEDLSYTFIFPKCSEKSSSLSSASDTHTNALKLNDEFLASKETKVNTENAVPTNERMLKNLETDGYSYSTNDDKNSSIEEESGTLSEMDSLSSEIANDIECSDNADKKSWASMKPLDWAEELEKRKASFGLHWEEGAAAQPMKLEGIRRGPPAIGYLQMNLDNLITRAVSSQTFKHDYGLPHVLAVHMHFIAVGTSKGVVLVFACKYSPHHTDYMDEKMLTFCSSGDKIPASVTSMCFNQQGDLLLVGYSDGHLTIWDVQKGTSAKVITGEHNAPVTHTLFLGQDSQVTRQFKAVTGDSKGLVLLHTFSVLILLNHFSIKTQSLLDGKNNGTVLCACPIVMDNPQDIGSTSAQVSPSVPSSGIGSMVGGVVGAVGGDTGWKLFNGNSSIVEGGVVVFATNQNALVLRLSPTVEVYGKLSRPDGVREGSMPYAAWKCMNYTHDSSIDKVAWLAIAWDKKIQIARLAKSEIKQHKEWILDSTAIGVAWLDDQMLVVITVKGQLCLFSRDGAEIHQTNLTIDCSSIEDFIIYHTHYMNSVGNPEKSYHNSVTVRGSTIYILGPMHLIISRLLPWKERIQVLQRAGDWMGALDMAMKLYDGHAHGVIDLPRTVDAIREAIMHYLVELILLYVDEVFSYISLAFHCQRDKFALKDYNMMDSCVRSEREEQYARVGGVAVEFCVHIKLTNLLFDEIFSKFLAVQHEGTFLEILEPYILRDMLGCLPPEIMQALVEHYSRKGWLERVEQCVLHMDISSLDFNQVVRLCREHGLYSALIYLFNRGLDDFKAPLEELLLVVQNISKVDAAAIGYKILVYLKYCFQGLAFPPGHGCLSRSRLTSVRKELMDFLLEDSKISTPLVSKNLKSSCGKLSNLSYILYLDTEAALDVLKCAFNETELSNDPSVLDLVVSHDNLGNQHEHEYSMPHYTMVQSIANALISILGLESDIILFFEMDDWPLEKDVHIILDFLAYLVTNKKATISTRVLKHLLKYLTSSKPLIDCSVPVKSVLKERQVLSVLMATPQEIWNFSFILSLCLEAKFFQACGLIHYIKGEHVAALDSYMKDLDEPIHTFAFINKLFLQLGSEEALSFQSAVISRISELVKLSRECTFLLVIDQLDSERQNIISELHSHEQSLFLFMKTVIDVHISGTINIPVTKGFSISTPLDISDLPIGIADYLEKLLNFPKLLHHDTIQVTEEMAELYLKLLCQFERSSVLKFLETFDNYRLEHCLRLCQEYHVTDAAAFLLERAGDVSSALELLMSGLDDKTEFLVFAVVNNFSDLTSRKNSETDILADILKLTEALAVRDVLCASVALCQRNNQRLDRQESESLWLKLFDSFSETVQRFCSSVDVPERKNNYGKMFESFSGYKVSKLKKCGNLLRRVFFQFIGEIMEGMTGYLPLPAVMSKLLSDNKNQEFGDFKMTILKLLGTYNFERRILDTAKSLIEDDTFYAMNVLKKGVLHALAPQNLICCFCGLPLTKGSLASGIRIYNCGHTVHLHCESGENESHNTYSEGACPVCYQHRKTSKARDKSSMIENGLVINLASTSHHSRASSGLQHIHETDLTDKPGGFQHMSRFDILNNLQKQKSLQMDIVPQLRLAPPAIYHEKVQKESVSLTREMKETVPKKEKLSRRWQLMEQKSKGSASRFTLKSSIFGTEKNKVR